MICCFCGFVLLKAQTNTTFNNETFKDSEGNTINAHGAGVLFHAGVYYLFGEIKEGDTWMVSGSGWENYRVAASGVSCYSSKDLKNWKNEGVALATSPNSSIKELDTGRILERPRVIYNSKTKKFVMWMRTMITCIKTLNAVWP